ncbi:MAG: FAD-binding protein [Candidatus Omnitrophota bacterium]|jgi:alkyl hydroperoxide reductase subunit F|nr:MAG: FAD-binding protein [Candidatus Omnitrophota bacterium]
MLYDVIIIGAGPAGITASVYSARKKISTLVISKDIGGQAAWSGDVENYTGYQFVTGPELAAKFEEHMRKYDIALEEGQEAIEIGKEGNLVFVKTQKETYKAKSAIIASGKRSRELGVPGEKEYKNKGLTYCATCDGPLFAGKDVAVIGGGNSAMDAVLQLMNIARRVHIINIAPSLSGDAIMKQKVESANNVTILNDSQVLEVLGENLVKSITVKSGSNKKNIPVEGIFVEIGLIPNSDFAKTVEKNKNGEIKINCFNETNLPGIFAAGDVTDVPEKQIIIAAGEGSKAALGVFKYLSQHEF